MWNNIKWLITGPIFLAFIYVFAIFSPLFRGAVLVSIRENIELIEADLLSKKIEADK